MDDDERPSRQIAVGNYIAQALGDGAKAFVNVFTGGTEEARAFRNRHNMLKRVHHDWVKGVLEQSLYGEIIRLGLMIAPQAVDHHPWDMILQTPAKADQLLPADTKILDVFDEMGQTLLILGEPGSGKTTMLLELARDTISRAEEDLTQPIPVVFNLSSWSQERKELGAWLIKELKTRYDVPVKVAKPWIENDDLLLLLDGLDEVAQAHRDACIQAINQFRETYKPPMAVCSRTQDYEALNEKLKLGRAVILQALTNEQVDEIIKSMKLSNEICEQLENDAELKELTTSPLMLSIFALAYQDVLVEALHALDTTNDYRKHLFNTYIQKVYERRGGDRPYKFEETRRWLGWLARKMKAQDQTVFLLENMQPSKLLEANKSISVFRIVGGKNEIKAVESLRWSRKILVRMLSCGLFFFLIIGLLYMLGNRMSYPLVGGLALALVPFLLGALGSEEISIKTSPNEGIKRSTQNGLVGGLVYGLALGLVYLLVLGLGVGLALGLGVGLFFMLIGGLFGGLYYGGLAVIQHYTLRLILWYQGHIPFEYVHFLDFAAERIYLRKVGGGYIFIHRMLLEHFAEIYEEQFAQKT